MPTYIFPDLKELRSLKRIIIEPERVFGVDIEFKGKEGYKSQVLVVQAILDLFKNLELLIDKYATKKLKYYMEILSKNKDFEVIL